jgi:exodeoxyribonuclease V alpha subunit
MKTDAKTESKSTRINCTVEKLYCAKPTFSAGTILLSDGGKRAKFRAKFAVTQGESVTLTGEWVEDPKYGSQFVASAMAYALPDSADGLARYLAQNPAFVGIGAVLAERIAHAAGSAIILGVKLNATNGLRELSVATNIPIEKLESLREAWNESAEQNSLRTALAKYELTQHQADVLIEEFGHGVLNVLRDNPYQIIGMIEQFGFRRVDEIAMKLGIKKDHPGRIRAGILYALNEEIDGGNGGNTWTGGAELIELANTLLALDGLDSRHVITRATAELVNHGEIVVTDTTALSTPKIHDAEETIYRTLSEFASCHAPLAVPIQDFIGDLNPDQKTAHANAMKYPISVISGGAGTGKTYTVARIARAFLAAGLNVALCAPTGKAAKRIDQLMQKGGVQTDEAQTIHRLLSSDGRQFRRESLSEEFKINEDDDDEIPLPPYEAVIMDEGSMIDVPLFAEVLSRIDFAKTRLVIVGDHHQLPPVGPGNVLRDILNHDLAPLVKLTKAQRQAGILKSNSNLILTGHVAPSAGPESPWWVQNQCGEPTAIRTLLLDLFHSGTLARMGFDPLKDVQIITPMHKGLLGTIEINKLMQGYFTGTPRGKFSIGDKVIQTKNDYNIGVMNGTIGTVEEITDVTVNVDFEFVGMKEIKKSENNIELAYCLTAHKCQGSEFPCAIVLCHKSHFFADRNWLYTAVTRAKDSCIILGDSWGLKNAAKKNQTIARRTLLARWAGKK